MKISSISQTFAYNNRYFSVNNKKYNTQNASETNNKLQYVPDKFVNFLGEKSIERRRRVQDIGIDEYRQMSDAMKGIVRKKCLEFNSDKNIFLENNDKKYLPLMDDRAMSQFIGVCSDYCKLKDEPILCLGRSPKWFLNTALWMKDGIDEYKFVAFSKFWYRKTPYDIVRIDDMAPTKDEIEAYRNYLRNIRVNPKHIVRIADKTGKKIVITDYVNTGKGACSFLEVMADMAQDEGVLNDFANSIRFYGIGSLEYLENFYNDDEEYSIPSVPLPEKLIPYYNKITQEYHDMPLTVFEQMLINENTNECRATYYPHETWTLYNPSRYRTGMISSSKLEELHKKCPKNSINFTIPMRDYRNLLNFRILDYLSANDLLRENRIKQWD